MSSWKYEVIADSTGKWSGNSVRFPTEEEAAAAGHDLSLRWLAVRDVRVVESEDPPNYRWNGDTIKPIKPAGG